MPVVVNIPWFEKCTDTVYWHNTCILSENPNIDLNKSCSQSICSLKSVSVLEYVSSVEMCWPVQLEGTERIQWSRDALRREMESESESELVICSALFHVKWDKFTPSYPPPPSLNLFEGKLHKGSEQSFSRVLWRLFFFFFFFFALWFMTQITCNVDI